MRGSLMLTISTFCSNEIPVRAANSLRRPHKSCSQGQTNTQIPSPYAGGEESPSVRTPDIKQPRSHSWTAQPLVAAQKLAWSHSRRLAPTRTSAKSNQGPRTGLSTSLWLRPGRLVPNLGLLGEPGLRRLPHTRLDARLSLGTPEAC